MRPIEIMDDLFFIQRGYLNGNHFVFRSDEPVLIDTAYISDFDETERLIAGLGVDLSAVRLIVSSHSHCDHIGGNKTIQDRSKCDITMHKIGKHFMDVRDDWSTWWRYYKQEAEFFRCAKALDDGDLLQVGKYEFRVIYTPGHASDGIVLYNQQQKVLISSDTLWEDDVAVVTERVEGSRACFDILESLDKISSLDVKTVYPGHGRPFADMAGAIAKAKRKIEGYIRDSSKIGAALLKKIMVYTLLMKRSFDEEAFFPYLMDTHWFKETVDFYFDGDYRGKYDETMKGLLRRGTVKSDNGVLTTTVKP